MLKESARYSSDKPEDGNERVALPAARLAPVEELTLGLKQKLHLKARSRAAPYCIRKPPEPVDLVDRLLQERALVAEAVRRLQALQAQCQEDKREPTQRACAAVDS